MMIIKSAFIFLAIFIVAMSVQQITFAMHDSALGVDTWLAQDNTTQLHTINLNGPVNQSAAGPVEAAPTTEEEPVAEDDEVVEEEEEEDEADEEVASNEEEDEEDEEEEDG